MSQGPYPQAFTYEQSVEIIAESINDDFGSVKGLAIASSAFALSLAYNKHVAVVAADIKSAMGSTA